MKRAPTWRNMFLLRRISGPRPHTAKSTIVTAGTNLSTTVLPCKALHDLHNIRMLSVKFYEDGKQIIDNK